METIKAQVARERIEHEFWVDRHGRVHRFHGTIEEAMNVCSMHYEIAHMIYPYAKFPDDVLSNLGWIAIGSAPYGASITKHITTSQCSTLLGLGHCSIELNDGKQYIL